MRYLFTYEPPQPNSPSEIVVYQGFALQRDPAAHPLSNWSGCHAFGPVVRTRIWKGFYSVPTPAHGLLSQLQTAETPIFKEPACARPCSAVNSRIRGTARSRPQPSPHLLFHTLRKTMFKVVVFQFCRSSHLFYTFKIIFHIKLESSSTGSSFPAVFVKPVPLTVGSRARK